MAQPPHWTVTSTTVSSRGTMITMTHRAPTRAKAYRLAATLLTTDKQRGGGLTLTITKEVPTP